MTKKTQARMGAAPGGAFLLRQTDKRLKLLARLAECLLDGRNQALVEHSIRSERS